MDIKKVIRSHGFTLAQVGAKMKNRDGSMGVSQATVSSYISGNPTLSTLQEIANAIGISVSELVSDESSELQQAGGNTVNITCPHCKEAFEVEIKLKEKA